MPLLQNWLIVEIITFYGLIISAIVFLLFSSLFKFKSEVFVDKNSKDTTDFITYSSDLYKYFGLCTTMLVVSIVIYDFEKDYNCPDFNMRNPLIVLITIHCLQVFSLFLNTFYYTAFFSAGL